jgi:hypothetical protein
MNEASACCESRVRGAMPLALCTWSRVSLEVVGQCIPLAQSLLAVYTTYLVRFECAASICCCSAYRGPPQCSHRHSTLGHWKLPEPGC